MRLADEELPGVATNAHAMALAAPRNDEGGQDGSTAGLSSERAISPARPVCGQCGAELLPWNGKGRHRHFCDNKKCMAERARLAQAKRRGSMVSAALVRQAGRELVARLAPLVENEWRGAELLSLVRRAFDGLGGGDAL